MFPQPLILEMAKQIIWTESSIEKQLEYLEKYLFKQISLRHKIANQIVRPDKSPGKEGRCLDNIHFQGNFSLRIHKHLRGSATHLTTSWSSWTPAQSVQRREGSS